MRPLLFLDFDGVLNSQAFMVDEKDAWRNADAESMLDPAAVALLDGLLREGDLEVVISSTWRLCFSLDTILDALCAKGLSEDHRERFLGKTPSHVPGQKVSEKVKRGRQIQAWLDEHGEREIVILDDDSDMAHLVGRLVQTDYRVGLQAEDCAKVLALVRDPSGK